MVGQGEPVKITRVEAFHVDWGGGRSRSAWVRIWSDSIGHTANLHFVASLTHSHYPAEYNGPYGVQDAVFRTPVRLVRGTFVLSDAPGLELDENELQKRLIPWSTASRTGV
jgi:L-alanine-DL-glutamate epimerase-like enolase superfamily enzyme